MQFTFFKRARTSALMVAALAAIGVASCGDDGETTATGADPSSASQAPAFLAATRVFTPDGSQITTYLRVLSSLDEGSTLDPKQALEVAGAAKVFSIENLGWFAVGGAESPTITRYTLGPGDTLQPGQVLSLQPYGVQSLFSDKLYVVSPTKVYYPDPDTSQLIVLDPTAMQITGTIPLTETARPGYTPIYSYGYVQREGKILFSVGWFDWDNDRIIPATGLVVLDTATDRVARFDVDERCGGITQPVTLASGDTYFASSALQGAAFALGRSQTEPCALRIKAGADAFDPSYLQRLRELTGGAIAGEPIPAGGDALFLRVYDAQLGNIEPGTATWKLTGQTAWGWRRWDLATGQVTPVAGLTVSTADTVWFQVGGRVFGVETTPEYANSTLIELTAPGGPRRGLTSRGVLGGLAKIR